MHTHGHMEKIKPELTLIVKRNLTRLCSCDREVKPSSSVNPQRLLLLLPTMHFFGLFQKATAVAIRDSKCFT